MLFLKIIILCIGVTDMLACLNVQKTRYFSNTVNYCIIVVLYAPPLLHLFSEGQIKCFCFRIETHNVSLTWLHQHYTAVTESTPSFFACTFGWHYANISTS